MARECGVTPQAAALWRKRWREGGTEAQRPTGRRGRRPSLSGEQLRQLEEVLLQGPKAQGYATDLRALERIGKLVQQQFGIQTFPVGAREEDSDLAISIDPIDGTESIETLQGGWSLIALYDRRAGRVAAAVAGDMFLNRIFWV